jgi:hypothetical protein
MAQLADEARMRKDTSSNQLFVLFQDAAAVPEEGLGLTRQASADIPTGGFGTPTMEVSGSHRGRALLKIASLLGGFVMVAALAVCFFRSPSLHDQASTKDALGEDMVLGSEVMPEDLQPAPERHSAQLGHRQHCSYDTTDRCPVSQLFYNSELNEVVTENLMQVGKGLFRHADRDLVRDTVAAGMQKIYGQLKEHSPVALEALTHVELTSKGKNAVLTWMRLSSIPEVQTIGYEVALAVRRSLSLDPDTIRTQIEGVLQSNLDKIADLRDDLLPPSVFKFLNSEQQWQMTLQSENLRVMQAFHEGGELYGSMSAEFYSDKQKGAPKRLPSEEKAYGAWGGVLEQGRIFLDIIKLVAASHGVTLLIPEQATALQVNVDVKDLGSDLLSCELYDEDGMNNFMKAYSTTQ